MYSRIQLETPRFNSFLEIWNEITDKNRIARIRLARRRKSTGTLNNILVTRDWLVGNLRSVYRSVNRVTPTNPPPQSNANSNLFSFQGNRGDQASGFFSNIS